MILYKHILEILIVQYDLCGISYITCILFNVSDILLLF